MDSDAARHRRPVWVQNATTRGLKCRATLPAAPLNRLPLAMQLCDQPSLLPRVVDLELLDRLLDRALRVRRVNLVHEQAIGHPTSNR
jgi:hypothetical protein